MAPEVLIVGAGPTGLVLALWLARLGVRVRIVDKAAEPGTTSRAVVVHARTLELYRTVGLAREIAEAGIEFSALNIWVGGAKRARIEFGRLGAGLSPFPYVIDYPQDEHERLLVRHLGDLGIPVERGVELVGLEVGRGRVHARLRGPEGSFGCEAAFVAGCDGAHSAVRRALGIEYPGGTYAPSFYVADVDAAGPAIDGEVHVSFDSNDFAGIFPLEREGHVRLIGILRPDAASGAEEPGWDDVSGHVVRRLRLDVRRVAWFSTYQVHHRVAARFRQGPVFLLGDAAHIHSPVGGQGMNTGIGDAVNLAWKLAAVLRERAPARILESYEAERIPFARRLTATTDRIFQLVTRPSSFAAWIRTTVVPPTIAVLFSLRPVRRFLFRTVSQIAIEYRSSPLSEGNAGGVHGGDRLPWVPGEAGDNFDSLEALDWQVHVYGAAGEALSAACASRGLVLHVFPWDAAAADAHLVRDACYLVRPDGYVAFADRLQNVERLRGYLDRHGLRFVATVSRTAAAGGQLPPRV